MDREGGKEGEGREWGVIEEEGAYPQKNFWRRHCR